VNDITKYEEPFPGAERIRGMRTAEERLIQPLPPDEGVGGSSVSGPVGTEPHVTQSTSPAANPFLS